MLHVPLNIDNNLNIFLQKKIIMPSVCFLYSEKTECEYFSSYSKKSYVCDIIVALISFLLCFILGHFMAYHVNPLGADEQWWS